MRYIFPTNFLFDYKLRSWKKYFLYKLLSSQDISFFASFIAKNTVWRICFSVLTLICSEYWYLNFFLDHLKFLLNQIWSSFVYKINVHEVQFCGINQGQLSAGKGNLVLCSDSVLVYIDFFLDWESDFK